MRICLINFDALWKDKEANIRQKKILIAQALEHERETDIIVFPELSLTGYVLDNDARTLAEDADGGSIRAMCEIAKKNSVALIFGFIEKNALGKPYNSVAVISKTGELITTYRKHHLFSQGKEAEIYTPGDTLSIFELA